MLIDASHPEETRVVVVRGNRVDEFDFESENKTQNRGNIYLAKVTRVEPSLQAAFVDYGGNRHGFLAFSEIHPDYYQIPLADRQALLEEEAEDAQAARAEEAFEEEEKKPASRPRRSRTKRKSAKSETNDVEVQADDTTSSEAVDISDVEAESAEEAPKKPAKRKARRKTTRKKSTATADKEDVTPSDPSPDTSFQSAGDDDPETMAAENESDVISEEIVPNTEEVDSAKTTELENGADDVSSVGAEDALEEVPVRRKKRRQYKIQEVIKRRQIILVQIVKEERGNKGAALTTYLSLAGRYSVLMPNTARGGGISRKITNAADRKRLKTIAGGLDVPEGMGVILRTAGASRTKPEIRRDFEYLLRLWENVRSLTLESTAPCLVYEEGSLIKRSIRDLYSKDTGEIVVSGDAGFQEAKAFMHMLMPSHAKNVKRYNDQVPIFTRNGVEAQLDKMLQPQVTLKSGGYLVINQTEALVAVDVNSGRSTRQHSIEDTAVQTNLEAAEEVARQLRLRDLAGLIVVDFIDMDEKRNNKAVENRLKDALKNDRARIQVSRISHFGLLEMSRQRIRASVLESTTQACPTCDGVGHVRSDSSVALHVLRSIEEYLLKASRHNITVKTSAVTALYILNSKRMNLVDLEARFGLHIMLEADETIGNKFLHIERGELATPRIRAENHIQPDTIIPELDAEDSGEIVAEEIEEIEDIGEDEDRPKRKRRRRRRGRGRSDTESDSSNADDSDIAAEAEGENPNPESEDGDEAPRKRRRRGRRGGRNNGAVEATAITAEEVVADKEKTTEKVVADVVNDGEGIEADESKPPRRATRRPRQAKTEDKTPNVDGSEPVADTSEDGSAASTATETKQETNGQAADAPVKPRRNTRRRSPDKEAAENVEIPMTAETSGSEPQKSDTESAEKQKGGWWQRRSFF